MSRKNRSNVVGALFSLIIPFVLIFVSLRAWEMDLNTPLNFSGDSMLGVPIIKSMCENGIKGLFFCEGMGAPEISALIETPFLDLDFALEVLGLNLFVKSPVAIFYLIYFLSFSLAGFTMYMLLNKLSSKVYLNVFFSVAYAIAPYHFLRGMIHLTLSNYYVVPIAIYLALLILEEDYCGFFPSRYLGSKWKIVLMLVACVILGWGNIYYVFFGLICIGVALVAKMIQKKTWTCLWREAVSMYVVAFSTLLSLLPKVLYTMKNGANAMASVRAPVESEIYGLKIIQMLLPSNYNRIKLLAKLNARYSSNSILINENSMATLGFIATVGFLLACVWLIVRVIKGQMIDSVLCSNRMNILSLMILTLVLYSVTGGVGSIVSYFITPLIRCFNRSSIVIACLALCLCVIVLNNLGDKQKNARYKLVEYLLLAVVGVFVLYSEVPINNSGWQASAQEQDAILERFFVQVEESLDEGSMVYELPFRQFPETGQLVNMPDYELALGYVYTNGLKWSYGAMKGRNTVGESLYIDEGMSEQFVQGIIDAGFSAVYIDTRGFEDEGEAINRFYSETLGLTPIISEDGWLYFYVLESGVTNG